MGDAIDQAKDIVGTQNLCLYKGSAEEKFSDVAPYLFTSPQPDLADWFFSEGWGQSWGLFMIADVSPDVLYRHLRRFLRIETETDRQLYFRFYDPRVLRLFLPTCNQQQLIDFFGPIRYFLAEDVDPTYGLNFWLDQGKLQQKQVEKAEMLVAYQGHLANLSPYYTGRRVSGCAIMDGPAHFTAFYLQAIRKPSPPHYAPYPAAVFL